MGMASGWGSPGVIGAGSAEATALEGMVGAGCTARAAGAMSPAVWRCVVEAAHLAGWENHRLHQTASQLRPSACCSDHKHTPAQPSDGQIHAVCSDLHRSLSYKASCYIHCPRITPISPAVGQHTSRAGSCSSAATNRPELRGFWQTGCGRGASISSQCAHHTFAAGFASDGRLAYGRCRRPGGRGVLQVGLLRVLPPAVGGFLGVMVCWSS